MNTSAGLCLRHTLYTVYTGFIFHNGICTLTVNHKGHILHTTDTDLFALNQLYLPSAALCIVYIHTVDLCCKQCCLISTCTCTDLHDNVLIIIRILRKKQNLQFILKFLYSRFRFI